MKFGDWDLGLEIWIGDWDWALRLWIGILDWGLGLGFEIGIGIRD